MALRRVVALAPVDLREQSRDHPERPADAAGLDPLPLRVLRPQSRRLVRTVREVFLALAAPGGHLGRTGDGPPAAGRPSGTDP